MDKQKVTISMLSKDRIPKEVSRFFLRSPENVCSLNGMLYLMSDEGILCCEDNENGNKLFGIVQKNKHNNIGKHDFTKDVWYDLLTTTEPKRIEAAVKEFGIEDQKKRTVIIFRMKSIHEADVSNTFNDIAPIEDNDHPVIIDANTIALIKESTLQTEDEIAEYAAAVLDTMVNEGISDLQAGIGTVAANTSELQRSYREALNALETGKRHHIKENVFRYSEQKLERIVDLIPSESRKCIIKEVSLAGFDGEILSNEIMETVRVFFEHDLNITSASRQLFIHRNTLNYRLDKIKRVTGLDLRTFQDAVVFRLISELTEKD